MNQPPGGSFPTGFRWGVATSAAQIEGAAESRGVSNWDVFAATPGKVRGGDDLLVACDHVNRYRDDVALIASLGVDSYRFSISWPRVEPGATGTFSADGLGFYDRLVDELLAAGVDPVVTLYHWDLPIELDRAGGWTNRDIVPRFVDYALAVHGRLGDRVSLWSTHNEPWCAAFLGYAAGVHAPGITDPASSIAAVHHLLLAHGEAVTALRADGARELGIVINTMPAHAVPGGGPALDDAVRRIDGLFTRIFTEPLLTGAYPDDVRADVSPWLDDVVRDGDLEVISAPLDWLGVNYYHDDFYEAAEPGVDDGATAGGWPWVNVVGARYAPAGPDQTDIGWPITPQGLREHLNRLKADYPHLPPVYLTENGAAYDDPVGPDGTIDDARRVVFLAAHLRRLAEAIDDGVDVRGYFAWSLMDNFEWAEGYAMRFGLVHVDFDTLERTPRRSAQWYGDFLRAGAPAELLEP
jgi:beta-glucosidase